MITMVKQNTSVFQRALASLTCVAMLWGQAAPVIAAPSQMPLVNRPENTPHPNFMLTLDDSGSMTYQYLPERPFTLNGQTVAFPNDGKVFMHPEEIAANIFTGNGRIAGEEGGTDTSFVTATLNEAEFDLDDAKKIYQLQMRSPQVNRIYYNPKLKYRPWARADGSRYPAASKTAANLDPLALDSSTSATANAKTVNLTDTTQSYDRRWYCGAKAGAQGSYFECLHSNKSFNPAIFYLLADNANPNTPTVGNSNYRLYNLNDTAAQVVYPEAYPNRDECIVTTTTTTCDKEAEWTNFANWFVYYRSRLFIAKASIPEAIHGLTDSVRLGWATIHPGQYQVDGVNSTIVQQGVRDLSRSHKIAFTTWIRGLGTSAGTPSKEAIYQVGQYFKRDDAKSPWSTDMVNGTPVAQHLQCRRSFNVLVTDGYYRQSNTSLTNIDDTPVAPSRTSSNTYTPAYPFRDSAENTLADFAMQFWKNDLQDGITDKVSPKKAKFSQENPTAADIKIADIKSDPATWQHLNQFMVGFGVTGTLPRSDATLLQLSNCGETEGRCWPTSPVNEIDDLWHAAINSRGEYFDVNTPDDLKSAIRAAAVGGAPTPLNEAGVATASSALITNNTKYVPEYTPNTWTGDIKAYRLDNLGNASASPIWVASTLVPDADARNIFVWDGGTKSAYEFRGSNVYNNMRTRNLLSSGINAASITSLVTYLRGGANPGEIYRDRGTPPGKLPDFVNSTPLFVKEGPNLGYSQLPIEQGGDASYRNYLSLKNGVVPTGSTALPRTGSVLLIGGNGGMMHGFNAATGVETFGFIPETALSNLAKITQRNYGNADNAHQYFVDGPLVESDVYTVAGAWVNMVYGTMGAGGRSIFALKLNMAHPEILDASSAVWETTASDSEDIGYITTEPQVGVLPNGKWKVFLGNGVESNSGKAALLMLDAETGAVTSLATPTPTGEKSGLGGVRLVKNSSGHVVAAYAGDIHGRLWRFEYDGKSKEMKVGYGGTPLFRAYGPVGDAFLPQPITATPLVVAAASAQGSGQLVIFGTGRLLYDTDSSDTSLQTVYGVLDRVAADQSTATSTKVFNLTSSDRNLLVHQDIGVLSTVAQFNGQVPTGESKVFIDVVTNTRTADRTDGWLMDLNIPTSNATNSPKDHPKVIYPIQVFGKSVLITSVKPASNAESCDSAIGQGYAFFLNALTGNKKVLPSLDADGNGVINADDGIRAGWSLDGGPQTVIKTTRTGNETGPCPSDLASFQSAGGDILAQEECPTPKSLIKDRIWRQLFNPPHP